MKSIYRLLSACALVWCMLMSNNVFASHSAGADISFACLGNNQYRITLNFYRDCAGIAAPTAPTIDITSATLGVTTSINLTLQSHQQLNVLCAQQQGNSTCNGGTLPGIEQYIYTGTYTFTGTAADWVMSYTLCCRNAAITNLTNPGNQNMYVEAHMNNTNGLCDNSPVFTSLPTPYLCNGVPFFYNHGGVDADGDSLVYTLINPLTGAGQNIPYNTGFTVANPMSNTGGFGFNTLTGQIIVTPSAIQNAVITVLVSEYRNGVKIGSTMRDLQFIVISCASNNPPALTGIDSTSSHTTTVCVGNQICFNVYSSDPDTAQTVTLTYNNALPGATFTTTSGKRPVGTFCWTPTAANLGTNNFVLQVQDNACPNIATETYAFTIVVGGLNVSLGPDTVLCASSYTIRPTFSNIISTVGYHYHWSTGDTSNNLTVSTSGAYTLSVTDSTGCSGTATVNVTLSTLGSASLVTPHSIVACSGQTTTLVADTGYVSYHWSTGDSSHIVFVTQPGTYFVTATNAYGCAFIDSAVITLANNPVVTLGGNAAACGTVSHTFDAGPGFTSYLWSDGSTNQTLVATASGTYYVTVTNASGCTATDSATYTQRTPPFVSLGPTRNACQGPVALTIRRPPGYTYAWNTGNTSSTQIVRVTGHYTITVTDVYGCSASASVQVNIGSLSGLTLFTPDTLLVCQGGSTTLAPAAGINGIAGYHWSTGDTSSTLIVSNAGSYAVTITDSSGCTVADTAVVNLSPAIVPVLTPTSTCSANSGIINLAVSGGTAPYTYNWSGPNGYASTASGLQGVAAGSYSVTITDALGCSATASATISQGSLTISAGPDSVNICLGSSTQLNATGGQSYSWSPTTGLSSPFVANPTATPTVTTTYIVTGTQPSTQLVVNGDFSAGNTGFNSDYIYTTTSLIPEGTYSVLSNPNTLHPAFHGLDHTSGTGNFMAVNGNVNPSQRVWCQSIAVNPGTDYSFSAWVTSLVPNNPAILDFTVNGISLGAPFTAPAADSTWSQFLHLWNSGTDTAALICIVDSNTAAGGNDFGIDDITFSAICKGYDTVTVVVNTPPAVHLAQNDSTCLGTPFIFDAGRGFTTYLWSDGSTNETLSTAIAGVYHVTVTDANGCTGTDSAILFVTNCCFPASFGSIFTTIDTTNNVINADQVWAGKYYVTKNVYVNGTATLDLTNVDVVFRHGTGIIFNNDSRITANNSVFRPCNETESWSGFTFNDNSSGDFHQNLVKNPETGMDLRSTKAVNITNSQFYNFAIGLLFDNAGGAAYDGEVTGNTFTNDDIRPAYADTTGNLQTDFFGVKLYNTNLTGLLSQNNFVNSILAQPGALLSNRYYGVYANTSTFSASSNTFSNMYRAFDVTGNGQTVTLENNSIEYTARSYDDMYAIRFTDAPTSTGLIQGNTITVSDLATGNSNQTGIYIDNASNLIVANNTVRGFNTLVRIGGGSSLVQVSNNTFSDAATYGVYVHGGDNYEISGNTINRIGSTGIYLGDVLDNAAVVGNNITIDNFNSSYGIRYVIDSGRVNSQTVKVTDNCVKNTSNALQFTTSGRDTIPVISNNYLYNYQTNGLWNIGFVGQVGSCSNYPTQVARNSFVSNYLAPFGTALDVRSDSTTLILAGNSGNLVINFPNVLVNTSCNTEAHTACTDPNGSGSSTPQFFALRTLVQNNYPLISNGYNYQLLPSFINTVANWGYANRLRNTMTVLSILHRNNSTTEMDNFFRSVASSSLFSSNDINWMSYIYSSYKMNYQAAASYLNAYQPQDVNAADLVVIEGVRNNIATNHRAITALTANEAATLTAIDARNVHYSAEARDMVQAGKGQHDYKFGNNNGADSQTPGAINTEQTGTNFLTIYPNPTQNNVTVRFYTDAQNLDKVTIRITDVLGQILYLQPVTYNNGEVNIDLGQLASGPYIISLMNDKETVKYAKLVKL